MWYISSAGNVLQGNTRWLAPGQEYTVGRSDSNDIVVHGKSISRKHVTIKVSSITPGSISRISSKEEIHVHDENTKFGTFIGDKRLESGMHGVISSSGSRYIVRLGGGKTLETNSLELRLGKLANDDTRLTLNWYPIVLTVSSSSDITKLSAELELMGVKMLSDFHPTTTHYVKGQQNSSKVIEALVNLKPIVTPAFAEALIVSKNKLKQNFLENIPDPLEYLPDPRYRVKPERGSVFKNMTFVFFERRQRTALTHVVNLAGGKGLYYDLNATSTINEIKSFLQVHARGALLMRHPGSQDANGPPSIHEKLALLEAAAKGCNLNFVEPMQFLEAILTCNTAALFAEQESLVQISSSPSSAAASMLQKSFLKKESQPPFAVIRKKPTSKKVDLLSFLTGGKRKRDEAIEKEAPARGESYPHLSYFYFRSFIQLTKEAIHDTLTSNSHENQASKASESVQDGSPNRSKFPEPSASKSGLVIPTADGDVPQPQNAPSSSEKPEKPEKRKATLKPSQSQKIRAVEVSENDRMFDDEPGFDDHLSSPSSLNEPLSELRVSDLVAVECCLPAEKQYQVFSQHEQAYNYATPNFKRFKRKERENVALLTELVDLETAPATSNQDIVADAMFASMNQPNITPSRATKYARTLKHTPVGGNYDDPDPDDDSLFVNSQDPLPLVRHSPGQRNSVEDDDDEDMFSFRFSR